MLVEMRMEQIIMLVGKKEIEMEALRHELAAAVGKLEALRAALAEAEAKNGENEAD